MIQGLSTQFIAPCRETPIAALGTVLAAGDGSVDVQVELHESGGDGRLTALSYARFALRDLTRRAEDGRSPRRSTEHVDRAQDAQVTIRRTMVTAVISTIPMAPAHRSGRRYASGIVPGARRSTSATVSTPGVTATSEWSATMRS